MKRIFFISFLLCSCFAAFASGEKPGVYALDPKALQQNKVKVQNKDASIMPAYKALLKEADKLMLLKAASVMDKSTAPPSGDKHDYVSLAPYFWPDSTKPGGLPYMRKDGQTNPEVKQYKDKENLPKLCTVIQTLGLAYYFSDNNAYAEQAAHLLRVWFLDTATRMNPNLNYAQFIKGKNDGRGAGLIDTHNFIYLIDGIKLMEDSRSWSKADGAGMKAWFAAFLNWMQTSKNGTDEMNAPNNHGIWYDAQRLSLALYIGNKDAAKLIVENAKGRLDKQMDDAGSLPKEMERTTSLHYTTFAFDAFITLAKMSENTGIENIWNYKTPSGKSLQKGFEVMKPYYFQQKVWTGMQIKDFQWDEAYPFLMVALKEYKCADCITAIRNIAGEKLPRLRLKLLTNVDL